MENVENVEILETNVVEYSVTAAEITKLQEKYTGFEDKDMDDKTEYTLVHDAERDLKKLRLSVEKRRKELKANALAYGKKVDAKAKEITVPIAAIESPLKEKRLAHDMKAEIAKREAQRIETERVDKITDDLAAIKALPGVMLQTSVADIDTAMEELQGTVYSSFDEFAEQAEGIVAAALSSLSELRTLKVTSEQQAKIESDRVAAQKVADEKRLEEAKRMEAEQAKLRKELDDQKAAMALEKQKINLQKQELEEKQHAARRAQVVAEEAQRIEAEKIKRNEEIKVAEDKKRKADAIAEEKRLAAAIAEVQKTTESLVCTLVDSGCLKSKKKAEELVALIKDNKIPSIKFFL